jgi:acyl phosphate:glycerol-3-phosphate acyltransferase
MREIVWILASYLIGCFTAGYYWMRWRTGQDIRGMGSGSVGARNVGRALGARGFAATFLLDAAKGAVAVAGAGWLDLRPAAVITSMVAVVAGHNWPMQLRFRGGKGIATSLGALLTYNPLIVLCLAAVFLPVVALLRNVTLSGLLALTLGPLVMWRAGLGKAEVAATSFLAMLALITHRKKIPEQIARVVGHREP